MKHLISTVFLLHEMLAVQEMFAMIQLARMEYDRCWIDVSCVAGPAAGRWLLPTAAAMHAANEKAGVESRW